MTYSASISDPSALNWNDCCYCSYFIAANQCGSVLAVMGRESG